MSNLFPRLQKWKRAPIAVLVVGTLFGTQSISETYVCNINNYSIAGTAQSGIDKVGRSWFGTKVVIDTTKSFIQSGDERGTYKPNGIETVKRNSRFVVYGFQRETETQGRNRVAKYSYRVYPDGRLKAYMEIRSGRFATLGATGTCS